jgi:hypothetical protein
MSTPGQILANEAAWAADRVERDRNPGPLDPVYFTDPADVPTGLADMWLLPTVCPDRSEKEPQENITGEVD